jgi:hypothetical protein
MFKSILLLAAIGALTATSVAAEDGPLSVTLQSPLSGATEAVAGGAVFSCKAATCIAESDTSQLDELAMCKDLARQLGPIAKFGSMAAPAVTKCNIVAKH